MPRFSVVIPCFNAAPTLPATLEALSAQSFGDWECICVDDGSTDRTREVVAQHAARDPRLRLAGHTGKGPAAARNAGVRDHATGEIVAFCDADDGWTLDKLARLDALFVPGGADAVFGRVGFDDGRRGRAMRRSTVPEGDLTIAMLLAENPVCTMSNLSIRRETFLATGGFDEAMVHNEDLDWLIRLVGQGVRVRGDDRLHVLYRANPGGLSSDLDAMAAGRARALATAARFGVAPDARGEAIFARYLARRALRLDLGRGAALSHALRGLALSPGAFLFPIRRGGATALAALAAAAMPRGLRRALFSAK